MDSSCGFEELGSNDGIQMITSRRGFEEWVRRVDPWSGFEEWVQKVMLESL